MRPLLRVAALALACSFMGDARSQSYTPLPVTGFNHDIVAEAFPNALVGTDTVLDATNHIMYSQAFAAAAGISGGLNDNGLIAPAAMLRQYQLAPFNGPNALSLVRGNGGTLTLQTPGSFSKLSLLAFSTEGASTINVSVRFTDNTVTNYLTNYSLSDWFFTTANVVVNGFGRINRVAAAPYGQDGYPSDPRFYYVDVTLNCADQLKTVAAVELRNTTTTGSNAPFPNAVFLALCGQAFSQTIATSSTAACASNGTATVAVSGTAGPYTVSWNTAPVQTAPTATNLPAGTYTATVTNSLGCATTVPVTVPQSTGPATVSAAPSTICRGTATQLTVNGDPGATQFTWTPGGLSGRTVTVSPTATTTYTVTVGGSFISCPYSQSVTVTVNQPPASPVTNDATVCAGGTATLSVQNPVAGLTYNWYPSFSGGGLLGSGPSFTTPPVSSQTVYYVEAVGADGCVQAVRTSASARVAPAPAAPVVNGASVCGSGSTTLLVQGPAAGASYNWYSAASGGTALFTGTTFTTPVLTAPTTYYVDAVGGGCTSPVRTPVTVSISSPPPMPAGTATGFCPGGSATFTVTNPSLLYTYAWYTAPNAGTLVSTGVSFGSTALSAPTTYYLEAYSTPGCFNGRAAVTATPFTALPAPTASVSATGNGSISFAWTAVAGAAGYEVSVNGGPFITPSSGSTGLTHTVGGLQPGQGATLTVRALGTPACRNSAASAPVTATLPGSEIYVPSAFTPNSDGRNDVLLVYGAGIAAIDFRVFDQWGAELFRSQAPGTGWDGTRSGKPQPSGVYVYALEVTMTHGSRKTIKGAVNLIR